MCNLCKRFPFKPVSSNVCGHIFCRQCYQNFISSVPTTICPGSAGDNCGMVVTPDQIEPLSGILRNLHSSINVYCSNSACKKYFPVADILAHSNYCLTRGSYQHSNSLLQARNVTVQQRVGDLFDVIESSFVEKKEYIVDVLFSSCPKS